MLKVTNDRVVRLAPPHSAPARLAPSGQLAVCPGVPVSRCRLARPVPARAQCLKFETDQAQDVKRLEKLNTLFFSYMCGKDPHADTELDGALSPTQRTVRTLTRRTVLALACRALVGRKSRLQHAACACAIAQPNAARPPNAARAARRAPRRQHARAGTPTRPPALPRTHSHSHSHTDRAHRREHGEPQAVLGGRGGPEIRSGQARAALFAPTGLGLGLGLGLGVRG